MTAYLAQITNKTEASKIMGISWRTVGNIVQRVVSHNLDEKRLDGLGEIGVDEFSFRKHHRYITAVVDHQKRRAVWAKEGKSSYTLNAFFDELGPERKKNRSCNYRYVSAFIKSIKAKASKAKIVFDLFHVILLASEAVDEV